MRRRYSQRFTKRLEVTFTSGGLKYRGISSDCSAAGLFIRTQHGLNPGTPIDIELFLPDGAICLLKGVVRRTVKTPLTTLKNGMGVELLDKDEHYLEFFSNFEVSDQPQDEGLHERSPAGHHETAEMKSKDTAQPVSEFVIIPCQNCTVKNKVPREKLPFSPKCGKCGTLLEIRDYV
jgi:hypothetical protein